MWGNQCQIALILSRASPAGRARGAKCHSQGAISQRATCKPWLLHNSKDLPNIFSITSFSCSTPPDKTSSVLDAVRAKEVGRHHSHSLKFQCASTLRGSDVSSHCIWIFQWDKMEWRTGVNVTLKCCEKQLFFSLSERLGGLLWQHYCTTVKVHKLYCRQNSWVHTQRTHIC